MASSLCFGFRFFVLVFFVLVLFFGVLFFAGVLFFFFRILSFGILSFGVHIIFVVSVVSLLLVPAAAGPHVHMYIKFYGVLYNN